MSGGRLNGSLVCFTACQEFHVARFTSERESREQIRPILANRFSPRFRLRVFDSIQSREVDFPHKKVASGLFPLDGGHPVLLARVNIVDPRALLATDVTTPVENAVTLLLPLLSPGIVATPTAQEVATIYPVRGDVADPVTGAERAGFGVRLAEVGRVLVVDQVSLSRRLEEVVFGAERLYPASGFPVLLHHHFRSAVVLVFQVVADDSEVGLGPPTSFHLAATGQSVTFALEVHVVNNGLKEKGKISGGEEA